MTDIPNVTDETADLDELDGGDDDASGDLVYQVEVLIEVRLPTTSEDAGFEEAYALVDDTLQRAWETDQSRHWARPWRFEMHEDSVRLVDQDPSSPVDVD